MLEMTAHERFHAVMHREPGVRAGMGIWPPGGSYRATELIVLRMVQERTERV